MKKVSLNLFNYTISKLTSNKTYNIIQYKLKEYQYRKI